MTVLTVFKQCVEAMREGSLIKRKSQTDKEFHFQDWVEARLEETKLNFEIGGRNKYPDFRMVDTTEGYEVKGLAYPGRDASFDSNSQIPSGFHNGRTIYYVMGRYPKNPDGMTYPLLDLVICHGDFINVAHGGVHKNKHVKGFGSYGDILIRDRKMYVAPTPFRLVDGVAHYRTMILPFEVNVGSQFVQVGELHRYEAENLVARYSFNLQTNQIEVDTVPNPHAGHEHIFYAWRLKGDPINNVSMRGFSSIEIEKELSDEDSD